MVTGKGVAFVHLCAFAIFEPLAYVQGSFMCPRAIADDVGVSLLTEIGA